MKITKRQAHWLEIITKCGGVFKFYNSTGTPSYQILNSPQEIDKRMVERLLKKNLLAPQGDGLLGDSQTYKTMES